MENKAIARKEIELILQGLNEANTSSSGSVYIWNKAFKSKSTNVIEKVKRVLSYIETLENTINEQTDIIRIRNIEIENIREELRSAVKEKCDLKNSFGMKRLDYIKVLEEKDNTIKELRSRLMNFETHLDARELFNNGDNNSSNKHENKLSADKTKLNRILNDFKERHSKEVISKCKELEEALSNICLEQVEDFKSRINEIVEITEKNPLNHQIPTEESFKPHNAQHEFKPRADKAEAD